MTKALTKVVYQPDPSRTDEYSLIVNPEEYKKWKEGDTSVPLIEVVDSFNVYHSSTGHQGLLGQPSKQQLDNDFGTHNETEVVKIVLEKGAAQNSDRIGKDGGSTMNSARGRGGIYDQAPQVQRSL